MPGPLDAFASLSVVIPAYNGSRTLRATLDDVHSFLASRAVPHEILVVDDGSTDDTAAIAERFARERPGAACRLLRNERNRGKGYSVRRGMLESSRDWRLFMDADNSTRITHLDAFAPPARAHPVLIASRRLDASRIVRRQHPIRQMLGKSFPYLVRAIALPEISDTQCGFKLFRADAAREIFPRQRVERFAFDVEILLLARRLGYPIGEVPVDWDNPTVSTVRIHADTFQMFADLIRSAWRLRRGAAIPAPRVQFAR